MMHVSPYLEQRAEEASQVYQFIVKWQPPDFGSLRGPTIKSAVLSGGGKYLIKAMLDSDILPEAEHKHVLRSIQYCRSVFDHTEIRDTGFGMERVFSNIFDVLLASQVIHDDKTGMHRIYRGHFDAKWQLIPSYYRSSPVRADNISAMVRQGRLAYLKKKFPTVNFDSLSELQQEAVIQHYLSGTRLLDFTKSLEIAAFFATCPPPELVPSAYPEFGAIYRISPTELAELLLGSVEAPDLPPQFLRIHRQQGVFIDVAYRQLINEPGLFDRWVFHHTQTGMNFECEYIGVTRENLLPEEIEHTSGT